MYTLPLIALSTQYPMTGALEVMLVQVAGMIVEFVQVCMAAQGSVTENR